MALGNGAKENMTAEVAVVGGGPAGLVSAIALKTAGVDVVLIAPSLEDDHRTTALLAGSVTALITLGVWEACRPHAAALATIHLVDDTGRLLRAPEVIFNAAEIGLDAFGYNIENRHLVAALEQHARNFPALRLIEDEVSSIEPGNDHVSTHRFLRQQARRQVYLSYQYPNHEACRISRSNVL